MFRRVFRRALRRLFGRVVDRAFGRVFRRAFGRVLRRAFDRVFRRAFKSYRSHQGVMRPLSLIRNHTEFRLFFHSPHKRGSFQ